MDPSVQEKLKAKFGAGAVRTGGKGSVRRKQAAPRKNTTQDDKKLQATLKRLNVNPIPAIDEVNLFKQDGNIIHFNNPRVQASLPAHTYVVSGASQEKSLMELMPGIISQLGPDNLDSLKRIVDAYQSAEGAQASAADDEVPDLVENFEAEAEVEPTTA